MATSKKGTAPAQAAAKPPAKPAAELRVYLTLTDLQPQFSSWMSSPLGARGYVAMQGTNALLVEIAPGLSIQRVIDLALKAEPTLEPGILAVERQFGVLELHSNDSAALKRAGQVILQWMGAKAESARRADEPNTPSQHGAAWPEHVAHGSGPGPVWCPHGQRSRKSRTRPDLGRVQHDRRQRSHVPHRQLGFA